MQHAAELDEVGQRAFLLQAEGVGAARRREARIHDDGTRAAPGLRLRAHALELDELAVEVEFLFLAPHPLDRIQPFLRVFVTRLVVALLDADAVAQRLHEAKRFMGSR